MSFISYKIIDQGSVQIERRRQRNAHKIFFLKPRV